MSADHTAVKQAAKEQLGAIEGFRGLEIDGDELVVYVVGRADEKLLPRAIAGMRVRPVVAEKLREDRERDASRNRTEASSGTYRIQKAKPSLSRKVAG